jgi:processive 1,2-diacylglycerol beta-glucosyltransferase
MNAPQVPAAPTGPIAQAADIAPADVLVLSARVGAGHGQAARAVVEAIGEVAPAATVRIEDVIDHVGPLFRTVYQGGYVTSMTRLPRLYGIGFDLSNHPDTPRRGLTERLRLANERHWLAPLAAKMLQWQPRVIVSTHFLVPPMLTRLIASGRLRSRLCVVVTDHFPHRWWYCEGVEHWFVPDEWGRDRFARWGIAAGAVTVCDIPVRLKWEQPVDRAKVLADWKLPSDKQIVLLAGGADFTCGPIEAIATGILAASPTAHVAVLAGRNKDLLARLSQLRDAGRGLTPVSFTDRAHELVGVSSLMVTKPGGVTTAECCAMGTPMVLIRPVPGQEGGNAVYLSAHGAAIVPGGPLKVIESVRRLLADPAELAAMSDRARELHRPAARTIAAKVNQWLLGPARS